MFLIFCILLSVLLCIDSYRYILFLYIMHVESVALVWCGVRNSPILVAVEVEIEIER